MLGILHVIVLTYSTVSNRFVFVDDDDVFEGQMSIDEHEQHQTTLKTLKIKHIKKQLLLTLLLTLTLTLLVCFILYKEPNQIHNIATMVYVYTTCEI